MSCCPYAETFEDEGLMPPRHDCPAPVPLDDDLGAPLTDLEHDLLRSLNFAMGHAEGRIIGLRGRWR